VLSLKTNSDNKGDTKFLNKQRADWCSGDDLELSLVTAGSAGTLSILTVMFRVHTGIFLENSGTYSQVGHHSSILLSLGAAQFIS
jgi:hypothetical protein